MLRSEGKEFVTGRFANHLPDRFPVGTRYVVEGRGGSDGRLRIHLRYLEFPDGRQVILPIDGSNRMRSRGRRRQRRKNNFARPEPAAHPGV